MTKTQIKTDFYTLLSSISHTGLTIQGTDNDVVSKAPLLVYNILDKNVLINANYKERFAEYLFLVKIYANSSVECTTISDKVDAILKPLGFSETQLTDNFDKISDKFIITSVYSIRLDENGIAYNLL